MARLPEDRLTEKAAWELMTEDFLWHESALNEAGILLHSSSNNGDAKELRLQLFEVIVAILFSQLRPEYEWWVTQNLPDAGIDFVGRGVFLSSTELGIDASITIGGQCKKRERVDNVVQELSGSLMQMADALHPTLFVAALSASLTASRVSEAKRILESNLNRHCHILDRCQLEGLIADNLSSAQPIMSQALPKDAANRLAHYFSTRSANASHVSVKVLGPATVLAGEPFLIRLQITRNHLGKDIYRMRISEEALKDVGADLLSPPHLETTVGLEVDFDRDQAGNPFVVECGVEFVSFAVGEQSLGTLELILGEEPLTIVASTELGKVQVQENLRPRFYQAPYQEIISEIWSSYRHATSGQLSCVAIVGAGGAGKTRLCEEISLEARRLGAQVVSARQAHSTEVPRRILANLLVELASLEYSNQSPFEQVLAALDQLEPDLAERAKPGIEALYSNSGSAGSFEDDQTLLSVLAVLIAQRSIGTPTIIHLHDLHWCTFDVLDLLDRLIWQLGQVELRSNTGAQAGMRVLFLLEGRLHEDRKHSSAGWSTKIYERFIRRLGCPVRKCRAFEPSESKAFASQLFEKPHSANRIIPGALIGLQEKLVEDVYSAAGGNPLHIIEQVKLLQAHGILEQNPRTGFVYMAKPDFRAIPLPSTVFETIEARWRYYRHNRPELAVLLWAAALVDDNLPQSLFRHLWRKLAPKESQRSIEATEFLRFPDDQEESSDISFRHENYYQTLRQIELEEAHQRLVIKVFSSWFEAAKSLSPSLRFAQAKVLLKTVAPNLNKAGSILEKALNDSIAAKDRSLNSRILATLLDNITWPMNQQSRLPLGDILCACDQEIDLCALLSHSGRTDVARKRIEKTLTRIQEYVNQLGWTEESASKSLQARRLVLLSKKARILFHNRRPTEAVAVTEGAVRELETLSPEDVNDPVIAAARLEVFHKHSGAVALSGDLDRAVRVARKAQKIAEDRMEEDPEALNVIITSANILLADNPAESESVLLGFAHFLEEDVEPGTKLRLQINLSMARIVLGYEDLPDQTRLKLAFRDLSNVFRKSHPLGRFKDASASALLLGTVQALRGKSDEIDWFTQAIALAIRSRQLETLWRAQINLAHALYRSGKEATDPARAALKLMLHSLGEYATPDKTPRFDLLAVPMAHAVRYLLLSTDPLAVEVLRKLGELRRIFVDVETATLKDDRNGRNSHEWFRVDDVDYVLY